MDTDCEDKYILKYGPLEQDFEEMQAEFLEASCQLRRAKEAKLQLQAEVRLLRKRKEFLKEFDMDRPKEFVFVRESEDRSYQILNTAWLPTGLMGPAAASSLSNHMYILGVSKLPSTTPRHSSNGAQKTKKLGKRKMLR